MRATSIRGLISLCALLLTATYSWADGLDIGDLAPEFSLQGSDGKLHTLSEYRGTAVVLAWFPKAFTGG